MKLIKSYNRVAIITGIVVLIIGSLCYYVVIKSLLERQVDNDLKIEEQEINQFVKEHNALPEAAAYKDQQISFSVVKDREVKRKIRNSWIKNEDENENEPYRKLTFPIIVGDVLYEATVLKSQVETEDLLQIIALITGLLFLLLILTLLLISHFLLKKLWRPFYIILNEVTEFNLKNSNSLQYYPIEIKEFDELNASVSSMAKRIRKEYDSLKEFIDNASHEIQTPLAIINSKLDLLLQSSIEEQSEPIEAIYFATTRLSKLNHTLLLLAKIENDQFNKIEKLNLKNLIEQKIAQFDELLKARNIMVTCKLENNCVQLNYELADIMLTNLLSNAIKHNLVNGFIHCELRDKNLSITNSGLPLTISEKHLFERFQKSNHSEGTGLGLAVVRQISETNQIAISYSGANNEHTFSLFFFKGC